MKTSFQISIPTPCDEDWGKFTPTSTGGFCGSCQNNVVDFSGQLVAYFRDIPEVFLIFHSKKCIQFSVVNPEIQ
jgi:hypothetical protein